MIRAVVVLVTLLSGAMLGGYSSPGVALEHVSVTRGGQSHLYRSNEVAFTRLQAEKLVKDVSPMAHPICVRWPYLPGCPTPK